MKAFRQIVTFLPIICVFGLAFILRFWQLGVVPTGPNWDEASLGYNAYSILKTGRDEYGEFLPLAIRSFGDYKPPLYVYLTVPSLAIFDLNLFAVRLPSAVVGFFTVVVVWLLVRELLKLSPTLRVSPWIATVSAGLLAISPWHLQFSRMASEANLGLGLLVWAIYFFLLGLKRGRYLGVAAVFFGLTMYSYHSYRIVTPLLLLLCLGMFYRELRKAPKSVVIALIIGVITLLPFLISLTDASSLKRLQGTSALNDQKRLTHTISRLEQDEMNKDWLGLLLDNRRVVHLQTIAQGYLSHFNLNWLFITGDNARHHAPGMGLLYQIELPFLLIGLFALAKYGKKLATFLLGWIVIAPIAASPTIDLPHAIRVLTMVPALQITLGLGIWYVVQPIIKLRRAYRIIGYICLACLWIFNSMYYLALYYQQQNREYGEYWQAGYSELIQLVRQNYDHYDQFVISPSLEQPQIFFLYFLKYDPLQYLAKGGSNLSGSEAYYQFDKFTFREIVLPEKESSTETMYIGKPKDLPVEKYRSIQYPNGQEAIRIVE